MGLEFQKPVKVREVHLGVASIFLYKLVGVRDTPRE